MKPKEKEHPPILGEIIKQKFEESGLTVTEFARRIHTSRRNVYEIFQKSSIETDMLYNISKVLGSEWIVEYFIEKFKYPLNSTNKCNFWSKKIIFFKEREKENILSPLYPDGEILFLSLSFLKKLQNETSHQRAKIRNKCNENKKLFTQRNSRSYW